MAAYSRLEDAFALLPGTLGDPNFLVVDYIGADLPADDLSIIKLNSQGTDDDSSEYAAVVIAASGAVVVIAMVSIDIFCF